MSPSMSLVDHRITLGKTECLTCKYHVTPGRGQAFPLLDCPKCKGTGKRGSGQCRNCKPHYGSKVPAGKIQDYGNAYATDEPCGACDGTRERPADLCGALPDGMMAEILNITGGLRIVASARELSAGESSLGILTGPGAEGWTAIYSATDYGRTADRLRAANARGDLTAELAAFRAEITEKLISDRIQAIKVADRDGILCSRVAVLLASSGFTVAAFHAGDALAAGERAA